MQLAILMLLAFVAGYYTNQYIVTLPGVERLDLVVLNQDVKTETIDMSRFWQVIELIENNYLDPDQVEGDKLLDGAISGMVGSIGDPYTSYFNDQQNQSFKDGLEGLYEGVGIQLGFRDEQLVVIAPLEGSPAEKAGIKTGESILKVNDESTLGWSLPQAVSKIRGEAGTEITLTLGSGDVTLKRAQIKLPAVRVNWPENESGAKIAHLRVLRFGPTTNDEWDQAVGEILSAGAKGIVLDLRNNPGGYLNASIYLASEFFRNGTVVMRETNLGRNEFETDHLCRLCSIPVIVLINEGSASASEILAGAIQSRDRGELIGTQSFGKGTVQEAIELDNGASVHITTARWLLPNGESINEVGITPEHEVEAIDPSGAFGEGETDLQLQRAIEILAPKGE